MLSLLLLPALFGLARAIFGPGRVPWIAVALAAPSPLHLVFPAPQEKLHMDVLIAERGMETPNKSAFPYGWRSVRRLITGRRI